MNAPGRYFHDEQHIQAFQEDRVHGEEVARQQAVRLGAQELSLGGIHTARGGPQASGAEDPADGRRTDVVAEAGHLAVYPAVSPRGVLPSQPQRSCLNSPTDTNRSSNPCAEF
jgi:hypothetical protein